MADKQKKTCGQCGSGEIYIRKDKSIFCRKCGHDTGTQRDKKE